MTRSRDSGSRRAYFNGSNLSSLYQFIIQSVVKYKYIYVYIHILRAPLVYIAGVDVSRNRTSRAARTSHANQRGVEGGGGRARGGASSATCKKSTGWLFQADRPDGPDAGLRRPLRRPPPSSPVSPVVAGGSSGASLAPFRGAEERRLPAVPGRSFGCGGAIKNSPVSGAWIADGGHVALSTIDSLGPISRPFLYLYHAFAFIVTIGGSVFVSATLPLVGLGSFLPRDPWHARPLVQENHQPAMRFV